jgi:hypothetical protein
VAVHQLLAGVGYWPGVLLAELAQQVRPGVARSSHGKPA